MRQVVLYVIPGCLRCLQAKKFLVRRRVAFKELNALQCPKSLVRVPTGFQAEFPIITIGTTTIRGLDLHALAAALRRP